MVKARLLVLSALIMAPLPGQWLIGAPGKREAPPGKHRYIMLVFANPIPGREAEFNDWTPTRTWATCCSFKAGWVHNVFESSPTFNLGRLPPVIFMGI
jgi:hypothetical protein